MSSSPPNSSYSGYSGSSYSGYNGSSYQGQGFSQPSSTGPRNLGSLVGDALRNATPKDIQRMKSEFAKLPKIKK